MVIGRWIAHSPRRHWLKSTQIVRDKNIYRTALKATFESFSALESVAVFSTFTLPLKETFLFEDWVLLQGRVGKNPGNEVEIPLEEKTHLRKLHIIHIFFFLTGIVRRKIFIEGG